MSQVSGTGGMLHIYDITAIPEEEKKPRGRPKKDEDDEEDEEDEAE